MKTDPRKACKNARERRIWALIHDGIAHPLMAILFWSTLSLEFHDWTSRKAWPRDLPDFEDLPLKFFIKTEHWGLLEVEEVAPGFWNIEHPRVSHALRTYAKTPAEAAEKAAQWFDELAAEHGGKFERPQK